MTEGIPRPRPSGRILAIDEAQRLLLAGVLRRDRPTAWVTPGGGAEPGETHADAACRELREETGMRIGLPELGPPVARQRDTFVERGVTLAADDVYYLLRVPTFDPDVRGLTDEERRAFVGWRWWTLDALDAARDVVFPPGVAGLVRRLLTDGVPEEPITLPPGLPW